MNETTKIAIAAPAPQAVEITSPVFNLVVSPVITQPVATMDAFPQPLGTPIMREGFITETGLRL